MVANLRVAIVGTGPAGMYAVEHFLEQHQAGVEVDLYERLPTPWGLVRAGVAPDHPEKKLVVDRLFDFLIRHPRVRLFANVEVGKHVRHDELADWYDAVIYATGAPGDTQMGIPGEELSGCWAAREFVAWYNGHPDYASLTFDFSHTRAVVVGNGNVALDVARVLTMPVSELEKTDMADYAIEALRDSKIQEVVILGRRGHMQSAFNNPELEELAHVTGVDVMVEADDFPSENEVVMDGADWETKRKVATLQQLTNRPETPGNKRILFRFLSSPVELLGEKRVEQVLLVANHLEHDEQGKLRARPTEKESIIDAGLVLRAIGYRGYPFPGLPFDERAGTIRNTDGRVKDDNGPLQGCYVTGWIKRGPQGVIGTNKKCARDTVRNLLADAQQGLLSPAKLTADEVEAEVSQRTSPLITLPGWAAIDHAEREAGRACGKTRVKVTNTDALIDIASR